MFKNKFWCRLMTAMAVLSLTLLIGGTAIAKEQITLELPSMSPIEKTGQEIITTGNVGLAYSMYKLALWNSLHPEAKVVPKFPHGRGGRDRDFILTSLAGGDAPCYYRASAISPLYDAVKMGAAADITEIVNDPKLKAEYFDHMTPILKDYWKNILWIGDRCYGVVGEVNPFGLYYRKDWFKEAGIFNAQGVGAPPDHWTYKDFREIAKKITDPKKKRWGLLLRGHPSQVGVLMDMERFGAEEIIPDKTGKYTWRAGFTLPPMVEYMTYLHDMIFEDKSVLTGIEFGWGECWHGFFDQSKGGMIYDALPNGLVQYALRDRDCFRPLHFAEAAGLAPFPIGKGGIKEARAYGAGWMINPLLTDAEKKATVEFLLYSEVGIGREMARMYDYWRSKTKKPWPGNIHSFCGVPPNAEYLKPLGYGLPADYIHAWNLIMEEKIRPSLSLFGMYVKNMTGVLDALASATGKIISDPNVDIKKALSQAAAVANSKLNYKDENITPEKLKAYYTAVSEYYKETAPDFYKNTFQPLLEKYYKVW